MLSSITVTRTHNYYRAEAFGVQGDSVPCLSDALTTLVAKLFATRKALSTLSSDHLTDSARGLLRDLTAFLP
jgi:hypothetical protein